MVGASTAGLQYIERLNCAFGYRGNHFLSVWGTIAASSLYFKGKQQWRLIMKSQVMKLFYVFILWSASIAVSATAVQYHGNLKVTGNQVLNQKNEPAVLRGMSFYWSEPSWNNPTKFWNASVVNWLVSDWNANIVRASMSVEPTEGYLNNPTTQKNYVKTIVDAAIAKGVYVIIDWHDHNAHQHQSQAISFFQEMARTYGNTPNVIYEIYNEPLSSANWANDVKPYAQAVINAIRDIDSDNLILVGSPNWDQDVDVATANPVSGVNIAYTLHFYAGSHGDELRKKGNTALGKNKALFISEWGTTTADGAGNQIYESEANTWIAWADQNNLSMCNWSVHDAGELSAALKGGASPTGNWSANDLSGSGTYVRGKIKAKLPAANAYAGGGTSSVTIISSSSAVMTSSASGPVNRIEAENFTSESGTQTEETTDVGGGQSVGYIESGDWLQYSLNVFTTGDYLVSFRVASELGGGSIQILIDGVNKGLVNVASTGGWQTWNTVSTSLNLTGGTHTLRLNATGASGQGLFNINWIEFALAIESPILSQKALSNTFIDSRGVLHLDPAMGFETAEVRNLYGAVIARVPVRNASQVTLTQKVPGIALVTLHGRSGSVTLKTTELGK